MYEVSQTLGQLVHVDYAESRASEDAAVFSSPRQLGRALEASVRMERRGEGFWQDATQPSFGFDLKNQTKKQSKPVKKQNKR